MLSHIALNYLWHSKILTFVDKVAVCGFCLHLNRIEEKNILLPNFSFFECFSMELVYNMSAWCMFRKNGILRNNVTDYVNKVRKEQKGKNAGKKIGFSREFFVGRECCLISIVKQKKNFAPSISCRQTCKMLPCAVRYINKRKRKSSREQQYPF